MHDVDPDRLIDAVSRELQRPVALGLGMERRVLERLTPRTRGRRAWEWLVRPRTLRLSPLAGLAMAAGVAALIVGARLTPTGAAPAAPRLAPELATAPTARAHPDSVVHTFVLRAPHASRVAIVGDFNDWDPQATPLEKLGDGSWSANVVLASGRYHYGFVIDGARWVPDPTAPQALADDFGRPNSVVTVAGDAT